MENKYIKALLWILLICFYISINMLFGSLINSMHIKNNLLLNILYIVSELIITASLIFLYRNDFKNKLKELKGNEGNKTIITSIKVWLLGVAVMISLNIILGLIVGSISDNELTNRSVISSYSYFAVITMIILTPICEEIIFRLSLSKIFDNNQLFIIFSGLIFGYAHVFDTTGLQLLYAFPYAALGTAFAYIFSKNKNILCSILMHSIHNLVCILIIFFL